MTQHVLFVCKSCSFSSAQRDYEGQRGGYHLLQNLLRLQQQWILLLKDRTSGSCQLLVILQKIFPKNAFSLLSLLSLPE